MDQRFGRAKYFLVYDTETEKWQAEDNIQNLNLAQGAGTQTAQQLAKWGVSTLITGNVGPKAFTVLKAAGIDVHLGTGGSVEEMLKQFQSGSLNKVDTANVEGHWM